MDVIYGNPLITIQCPHPSSSFWHMYLFPDYAQMETPDKLKAFLADLYSGKFHREFYCGPNRETTSSGDALGA